MIQIAIWITFITNLIKQFGRERHGRRIGIRIGRGLRLLIMNELVKSSTMMINWFAHISQLIALLLLVIVKGWMKKNANRGYLYVSCIQKLKKKLKLKLLKMIKSLLILVNPRIIMCHHIKRLIMLISAPTGKLTSQNHRNRLRRWINTSIPTHMTKCTNTQIFSLIRNIPKPKFFKQSW